MMILFLLMILFAINLFLSLVGLAIRIVWYLSPLGILWFLLTRRGHRRIRRYYY
ncbi:MAG: hypothetical protein IJI46_10910 [Erysipelotrichaceae bacterium]|nr:hypothetical protein [Erysipelotrichaceae bacterium]